MEMSLDYMAQTAKFLSLRGYSLRQGEERIGALPEGAVISHCFDLQGINTHLRLETVSHPVHELRFFLEVLDHHGLRTHCLALDSWKHREQQVEFKFYALPEDGRAVSFILRLQPSSE